MHPTGNTVFPGRTGPYHLNPFEENLGKRVDTEGGARVVNVDWFDDGFKHFFFLLVQVPVPTYVTVDVTVPGGAPPGTRYINMAVDFDQDGKWRQYLDPLGQPVDEWVVRNVSVNVPGDITPGVTQPLVLPAFGWGSGLFFAYPTWFRVTLTQEPLNASDFGLDGWDGSGPGPGFVTGETEDYFWRGYGRGVAPGGGGGNNEGEPAEGEGEGEGEEEEGEGTGEGEAPCEDVRIVWMPRIVPLGQEGARFCIRVCNRCAEDVDVSIKWEKVDGNTVGTTQAPDPATVPAGRCIWICFTSFWIDAEPVGSRLGRYRPVIKVSSDKRGVAVFPGDEVLFQDTLDPSMYSVPAQVQTQGGSALTAALNLSELLDPDYFNLLLPQVHDWPMIEHAGQITYLPQPGICADVNSVYHAVDIQTPGELNPPALVELPVSTSALLEAGCVLPVRFNPATLLWEGLTAFYLQESEGLVFLEASKPGLYGLAGKVLDPGVFSCAGSMDATEVVPGSASGATGTLTVEVDPLTREAVFQISHTVASPLTAFVHTGVSGEAGPVLLDLGLPESPITAAQVLTLSQLELLREGRFYIEVTSNAYPEGDIRGQVDCGGGEGEGEGAVFHPGDLNQDWQLILSEAIAYLSGWQQGTHPMAYAIRAAYLWQSGEFYDYDPLESPPLCWVPTF